MILNYIATPFYDDVLLRNNYVAKTIERTRTKPIYTVLKRIFDVVVSGFFLVALSPLFLILAFVIKLTSHDSAIFKQERVGMYGNSFTIYKFRTMASNAPEVSTNNFHDSCNYITKIGRVLRKSSLDELPQLYNVFRGDMSIIGPRPLIKSESDNHRNRMAYGVYDIRPGITGWAQINGRDCISDDEKVYYDYQYLVYRSVFMDVLIFVKTIFSVAKSEGQVEGH